MRVETRDSIWIFDEDAMIYSRFPKSEDPSHSLPYSRFGKPAPYVSIERGIWFGGERIHVVTEGDGCYTGVIISTDDEIVDAILEDRS